MKVVFQVVPMARRTERMPFVGWHASLLWVILTSSSLSKHSLEPGLGMHPPPSQPFSPMTGNVLEEEGRRLAMRV
jgi:hypothetical protein